MPNFSTFFKIVCFKKKNGLYLFLHKLFAKHMLNWAVPTNLSISYERMLNKTFFMSFQTVYSTMNTFQLHWQFVCT